MKPADHDWVRPPAGQSGLPLCSKCGQRKVPDLMHPDHPHHGCQGVPRETATTSPAFDYDPLAD